MVIGSLQGPADAEGSSVLANTQTIRSESWLHPPIVHVSGQDPDAAAGDLFVDVQNAIQAGPMILDPSGQLIWFKAMRPSAAFNLQVQNFRGQSVLTYWQGQPHPQGVNSGVDVLLDHNYKMVATVPGGNGLHPDLHEFQITPQGTALIIADRLVSANLSSIGGPHKGTVLDQVVQEDDIATGKVVWQWDAYRHIRLADTYVTWPIGGSYDPFHLNSIQQLPNGNLLISMRHTWAVYEVDKRTGRIVWKLGGRRSSFKMERGTAFLWQHDAQLNGNTLTVFDNGLGPGPQRERQSRAVRIKLNFGTRRATLVQAYTSKPSLLSPNEGSVQTLPDGNTFVGWGGAPYFSEFGPRGQQLFSVNLPRPMQSYRAYRFPWWGQPTTPPSISVASASGGATVYASWDGATAVASWEVLAGPNPGALVAVGQFPKTAFETTMPVSNPGPYFAVQAQDASGQTLSTSPTVTAAR